MNLLFALIPLLAVVDTAHLDKKFPLSPPHHYEQHISDAKMGYEERWEKFASDRTFTLWTPGRSKESIAEEYENLRSLRRKAWFIEEGSFWRSNPDYLIAEDLISHDYVREPNCVPFEYNKACNYYNGSIMQIGDLQFLALMGPRDQDVPRFFRLLMDASVAGIVRLTPAFEGTTSKCHPYWENRLVNDRLQITYYDLPAASIPYFAFEGWLDNTGTAADKLFEFTQKILNSWDPAAGPLAVHCTNGVGRTGTVIAAIALLDQAERQIKSGIAPQDIQVSVEETVLRLSLQRFFQCAQTPQYESLYRILELYVDSFDS